MIASAVDGAPRCLPTAGADECSWAVAQVGARRRRTTSHGCFHARASRERISANDLVSLLPAPKRGSRARAGSPRHRESRSRRLRMRLPGLAPHASRRFSVDRRLIPQRSANNVTGLAERSHVLLRLSERQRHRASASRLVVVRGSNEISGRASYRSRRESRRRSLLAARIRELPSIAAVHLAEVQPGTAFSRSVRVRCPRSLLLPPPGSGGLRLMQR
jgi:hypothetical protein